MSSPIGVFDSGLGGLTVLRALRQRLPDENFLYFADTRYLPYGDRPEAFLRRRGQQVADALLARGAKALVVACNTATAVAAETIRAHVPVPVVALEPGVKPAAALSRKGVIGVLATTRTLASARFQRLVDQFAQEVRVLAQGCPGLAEAIELHGANSPQVEEFLDAYVAPLAVAGVDVVALGCTHYPWVAEGIARRLPSGTQLVDTGEAVARQLERVLHSANLRGGGQGRLTMASSGEAVQVEETIARLWGERLPVECWDF
ncbi:MAG: glutamate racemase [Proteobacteria bacterium]|nr:glutamate racemase [Pseudomonadota bacterium]